MLVVIDRGEVDHGAHEACTGHVPESAAEDEEPALPHDVLLLAGLFALLGELYNLRVLPDIEREQDERGDVYWGEDAPACNRASGLGNPAEIVANANHCNEEEEQHFAMKVDSPSAWLPRV